MISNLQDSLSRHRRGMLQRHLFRFLPTHLLLHYLQNGGASHLRVQHRPLQGNHTRGTSLIEYYNLLLYLLLSKESGKRLTSRSLILNLRKKDLEPEYWPRLTKEKIRNAYIKTDFSKWIDEDEQDGAKANFDEEDFGGGGGMPGLGGGMPGLGGGMPGLGGGMPGFGGGMGGGMDFDMEKVRASFDPSEHKAYRNGR